MSNLELIAATSWFWLFSIGFIVSMVGTITAVSFICINCKLFSLAIVLLYFVWIWCDRKTCENGGRPIEWVRKWTWWQLMKDYFHHQLIIDSSNDGLDPKRNYLFACFPHGIFPVGTFASFVNPPKDKFPKHRTYLTALGIQFWLPVIRELFLSIGSVTVTAPALKYLLKSDNGGGNIVSVLIGGGDESKFSQPGTYKIILNKRKGFVKLALQCGSPLVPVISFGETDVFDQLDFPGFSLVRNLIQNVLQVAIVLPFGRFGICPYQVPVVTVVGPPIEVKLTVNPTNEEIENLHGKFVEGIRELFEKYKGKYVKNPGKTYLEIV